MRVKAADEYRVNRMGPIGSDATNFLTITKAADAVTTPVLVSLCGYEDSSGLTAFSVVGGLDVIADTVEAPLTEAVVENIIISNVDTADHVFTFGFAVLTGALFTVTIKAGDIWSWRDGYLETSSLDETNQ